MLAWVCLELVRGIIQNMVVLVPMVAAMPLCRDTRVRVMVGTGDTIRGYIKCLPEIYTLPHMELVSW